MKVVIIVAHPDDETLWAGGTLLSNSDWKCFALCLCRGSDPDRAPRFLKALDALGVDGVMGDLDDGPDQIPLDTSLIEHTILNLLPSLSYDLILTHSPKGEYTRHLRHEEVGKSVTELWQGNRISSKSLWQFAYEDGSRSYCPRAIEEHTMFTSLPIKIWRKKFDIITQIYGFDANSWEARSTPKAEAFWVIDDAWKREVLASGKTETTS